MEVGRWVRVDEDLGAYRWCRSARWIPRRTLVAPLSASSSFVDHVRELCWFKIHKQLKRKRGECKMTRFLESLRSFSHLQIRVNHKLDFPQHAISNSNPQVHQLSEPFSAFIDVTGQKATSSTRPRYCSVSTEAMASVAFNMSARAAVGGAQLKLSAQRKRGAYPRIVPRGPVSGAPSAGISPRV